MGDRYPPGHRGPVTSRGSVVLNRMGTTDVYGRRMRGCERAQSCPVHLAHMKVGERLVNCG
jgi:hypothetical protein